MKLIVGLGNVGNKYINNRHNLGFRVVDLLANHFHVELNNNKFNGIFYKGDDFILAKPHTYMNLSGDFVNDISHFYKIDKKDILIIYDDIDMEVGKIRVRESGSSGGQNGMKDIMLKLNTMDILRLKIGIGRPRNFSTNYVLSDFTNVEWAKIKARKGQIIKFVEDFIAN